MSVAIAEEALRAAIGQRDSARNRTELDEGKAAITRAKNELWAAQAAGSDVAAADRRDERADREAHAAKRPERWAALTPVEQALYVVAAGPPISGVRTAFRELARLLGSPTELRTPPETFERQE